MEEIVNEENDWGHMIGVNMLAGRLKMLLMRK